MVEKIIAYCMRCKAKREATVFYNKNTSRGVKLRKGKCSKCGTTVAKLGA